MALGGKYPVLLVGLVDVLTPDESQILKKLSAMSYGKDASAQKAANEAKIAALKSKAVANTGVSITEYARLPIVLDGNVIPASVTSSSSLMIKQLNVIDGVNTTAPAANTVSIDIKTSTSANTSIFIDLLFSVADIIFSKSDIAPSVSFFGGNLAILNGYLVRMSRRGGSSSTEEIITLEIAKEPIGINEKTENIEPAEKTVDILEPADNWQVE